MKKFLSFWVLMLSLAVLPALPVVTAAEEINQGSDILEEEKVPATPVIRADRNTAGNITVRWNAAQDAYGYAVYIFEDKLAAQRPDEGTPVDVISKTSYVHKGGEPGVTYYYRVLALSESGLITSDFSNTVKGTCKLGTPKVTTSYEADTGWIILKWKEIPDAAGYKVYATDLSVEGGTKKLLKSSTDLQCKYTRGIVGHTYRYSIVAVCKNSAGNSPAAELEKPYYTVRPVLKVHYDTYGQCFQIETGDTEYYLYTQYREQGGEWKWASNGYQIHDKNCFKPGVTYEFRARLSNSEFQVCSEWSKVKSCLCRLNSPSLSSSTKKERPYLSWKKVDGATHYDIYRKIDGKYKQIATVKQSGSKMYYLDQDTSLKYGSKYYYRIVAGNQDPKQDSGPSNSRGVTYQQIKLNMTELFTCVAPESVGPIKVSGTSKEVTWSSSNTAVATVKNGYIVAKKTGTVTITAKVDGLSLKCKVKVLSDSAYVEKVAELWVESNITSKMSLQKKLLKASKAVMDGIGYDKTYTSAADAMFYGYGNSKAAASVLKAICQAMGYKASIHCMENDSKSMYPGGVKRGASYYNVKVVVDGDTYYIGSEPESVNCYLVKNGKCIHREKWISGQGWKDVTG